MALATKPAFWAPDGLLVSFTSGGFQPSPESLLWASWAPLGLLGSSSRCQV